MPASTSEPIVFPIATAVKNFGNGMPVARAVMLPKPTIGFGTAAAWVTAVPVSRAIPSAEMTPGRKVAVAAFDPSNPADAVVLAVWV